jgi:hypothetical protein
MAKIVLDMSMSLDGFIAGLEDGIDGVSIFVPTHSPPPGPPPGNVRFVRQM